MENDPKWLDLKGKVQAMIDSAIKEEMVLEAQRIKLEYGGENRKLLLQIIYGIFGFEYKYYLERTIMGGGIQMEYSDSTKGRGCIASMLPQ